MTLPGSISGTDDSLREVLDLRPHPEGGWYRETWRTEHAFTPSGYPGERASATGIYFLLHPGERSRWHIVRSDELWLWHAGGPLILRLGGVDPAGPDEAGATELTLGMDLAAGQRPQLLVPGGGWQSAEPAADQPVLVSCIVSPGFDFADFRLDGPARD
jgi:predicted cupin superfamily sugar epimerase